MSITQKKPPEDKMDLSSDDDCCPICQEGLECKNLVRLLCFHSYHYECILDWYKVAVQKPQTKRSCPLCREYGGFLPRKFDETPIPEIHFFPNNNKNESFGKHVIHTENNGLGYKCPAPITTKKSKNFGKPCGNLVIPYSNSHYCGVHKHLFP